MKTKTKRNEKYITKTNPYISFYPVWENVTDGSLGEIELDVIAVRMDLSLIGHSENRLEPNAYNLIIMRIAIKNNKRKRKKTKLSFVTFLADKPSRSRLRTLRNIANSADIPLTESNFIVPHHYFAAGQLKAKSRCNS
jgi:hypothetical protein